MTIRAATKTPWWALALPLLALVMLGLQVLLQGNVLITAFEAFALVVTVFAAVYHAEVVAQRVGEPFGSLVLALAVTIIEVALIVSVMITGAGDSSGLARDTIFAAVMIVCNGIVGLCLLGGGLRHHEQDFQLQGAKAALSVLIALTSLSMVFPNVTTSTTGRTYSFRNSSLRVLFRWLCTGRFFSSRRSGIELLLPGGVGEEHSAPPPSRVAATSAGLLLVALVAIVGLAKVLTPTVERAISKAGAPESVVGVVIAALVLTPEGLAAFRSARANRLQVSMNLALGSALASIGLTIPAVATVSIFLHKPLTLGLEPKEIVLLFVTLILSQSTLGTGRTTVLQGIVHLVMFAVFLFLAVVP